MRVLILDASSVNDIDSSADAALQEVAEDYAGRGIELYMAHVKGVVLDVMRRSGLYERLGADHFFLCTDDAVRHAEHTLDLDEIDLDVKDAPPVVVVREPVQP